MKTNLAGVFGAVLRAASRALRRACLGLLLAGALPLAAAVWIPDHTETVTGTGWIPVWVDGHYNTEHVAGYWADETVEGHWEDAWIDGHEESSWVDGYWEESWTDGHWEENWVDGYSEESWIDGYWEESWVDGYYDDDGNWQDGYSDWAWVDGHSEWNYIEGHSEWNWVEGHSDWNWVEGRWDTQWFDGYWDHTWVPESTRPVWVEGYDVSIWIDGYWTLGWGTWNVDVFVAGHWEGDWTWESHDVYGDWYWFDWSPDPSTVAQGTPFTQSRDGVRSHVHWETNEAGEVRDFTSGPEYTTGTRTATGTSAPPPPTTYTLNVSASPSAGGDVSGGGSYASGTSATVSATANSGYVFSGWGGDASGSESSTTIVMNGAKSVTANFTTSGGGGGGGTGGGGGSSGGGAPVILTPPISQTAAMGTWVSFSVVAGGEQPFTYQWAKDGVNLAAVGPSPAYSRFVGSTDDAGLYSVTVHNARGSVTANATLSVAAGGGGPGPGSGSGGLTAPTGLQRVVLGATFMSLRWTPLFSYVGIPIYEVSLDGGATVFATNINGPRYTAEGLNPGTIYTPAVRLRNSAGQTSSWSAALSVTTLAAGAAPVSTPRWIDVNGDGLLDEVIDAGSPSFGHFAAEFSWVSVTYSQWIQFWVPVPGYFYTTGFYADGDGSRYYVPPDMVPSWVEFDAIVTIPLVRPVFQFTAEPGYDYEIRRSNNNGTLAPEAVFSIDGLLIHAGINEILPSGPWSFLEYYTIPYALVRHGLAYASTRITINGKPVDLDMDPTGSVAKTRGIKIGTTAITLSVGTRTVTLNDGTQVEVTVTAAGEWIVTFPDGTVVVTDANGKTTVKLPAAAGSSANGTVGVVDQAGKLLKIGAGVAASVITGGSTTSMPSSGSIYDVPNQQGGSQINIDLGNGRTFPINVVVQPRILLLLHGMNSDRFTWNTFVQQVFGGSSRSIVDGRFATGEPIPAPNSKGVYCYRLQFGFFDPASTRVGAEPSATVGNALGGTYVSDVNTRCGDFETFAELGQEVDDAIGLLLTAHPNAQIVLVGHSRGGLAARAFLQGSSARRSAVIGLLTTMTPHLGSRLGRIFGWLQSHPRGTPGSSDDWQTVDWLISPTALGFFSKPPLDIRRPIIDDVADNSAPIANLNAGVANLPPSIRYGEIAYHDAPLGILKLGTPQYQVFDVSGADFGEQLSSAATAFILGTNGSASNNAAAQFTYRGEGLIPAGNQAFTQMIVSNATFAGSVIPRRVVTGGTFVHTDGPQQTTHLRDQLVILNPSWWP